MIKHLQTFFYPTTLKYSYNQSKQTVIAKVEKVLTNKSNFFGDHDMKGSFLSDDTFILEIQSFSFTNGVKYSSKLQGKIIESNNGTTCINIKAKPSRALYVLFFVTSILGIAYFYEYFQTNSFSFLFLALAMLLGGPLLSIGISNAAIASIGNRYKMYIHKELIEEETSPKPQASQNNS
jgi:hypothetical protein